MHMKRPKAMSMGGECIGPMCKGCSAGNCYADGGKVQSDMSGGQKRGPEGYPKYQEQAQNERGINRPVSGVTQFAGGKGTSEAGSYTKETYGGKPLYSGSDHPAKEKHRQTLSEMKSMKKPHGNYAEGGEVTDEPDNLDAIGTDDMDDELHDMLGSEILGAIEAKDHKMIWSGLEALVLSIMNKE